jgi:hypothetical protein
MRRPSAGLNARMTTLRPFAASWSGPALVGLALALTALAIVRDARADVIISAAGLNATLKKMERLRQDTGSPAKPKRDEALFQTAVEAEGLAALINAEVASHGMQERELIDLALSRTKELGIAIAYNREKKKFFYDGAAFERYLQSAPNGPHAAAAEFQLLSNQFYQSTGVDPAATAAAAEAKKRFLARHPGFKGNAELSLFLAVDYRDLYRHYRDVAPDAANVERYLALTRAEYRRIATRYAGTEQAQTARQLLRRLDEETRAR